MMAIMASFLATDLYLPAIPDLPAALNGNAIEAQDTLAAFAGTFALGQLVFGALGDRYDRKALVVWATVAFAAASVVCAFADSMPMLIYMRGIQGFTAAAATAIAPAILRGFGDELHVIRLFSALTSIEAIAPAAAPIAGVWLVAKFGWPSTFYAIAALALTAVICMRKVRVASIQLGEAQPLWTGYVRLLRNRRFNGYAWSQALGFAGLMTFIFSSPYLIVTHMGGTTGDFAIQQVILVVIYVVTANLGAPMVARIGTDAVLLVGCVAQMIGASIFLAVLAVGNSQPLVVALAVTPFVAGLGLRSGPGFTKALDVVPRYASSASAALTFIAMALAALGTRLVATRLEQGLWPVAIVLAVMAVASFATLLLVFIPDSNTKLKET